MEKLVETEKLVAMMEILKGLTKSPVPVVQVHGEIMLTTLRHLLREVHPDYLELLVDDE